MDYTQFAPIVLGVCGTFLQWIRQYRKNSEWIPGVIAFLLAVGVYIVVHPFTPDWRLEVLSGIAVVAGYTSSVLGGTYIASRAASAGMSAIPVTNSK
jgi:hypothetical protein